MQSLRHYPRILKVTVLMTAPWNTAAVSVLDFIASSLKGLKITTSRKNGSVGRRLVWILLTHLSPGYGRGEKVMKQILYWYILFVLNNYAVSHAEVTFCRGGDLEGRICCVLEILSRLSWEPDENLGLLSLAIHPAEFRTRYYFPSTNLDRYRYTNPFGVCV
jgi:hypothetical protein